MTKKIEAIVFALFSICMLITNFFTAKTLEVYVVAGLMLAVAIIMAIFNK